jgi:hypothetical protein
MRTNWVMHLLARREPGSRSQLVWVCGQKILIVAMLKMQLQQQHLFTVAHIVFTGWIVLNAIVERVVPIVTRKVYIRQKALLRGKSEQRLALLFGQNGWMRKCLGPGAHMGLEPLTALSA